MNAQSDVSDSVVKVIVTANQMDYYRPWQSQGIQMGGGSATIIEGNRILTNAHVVADQTFIQLKKDSDPRKYIAKVMAIGNDCDLALLTVNDPEFFKGTEPLVLGKIPQLQDMVSVVGFPEGGDKLSITQGVVSRLEVTPYSHSARQFLSVQIDAAINPGNSGGPVIQDGKLVGIAMQILQQGQNIGYMIPIPIIEHFLKDYADGHYDGFPMLGLEYNNTENPGLRTLYKIQDIDGGVLITRILPNSSAEGILLEGDVILKIDGVPIAEDGTFEFSPKQRLELPHLISQKQMGDTIVFNIMRNGEMKEVSVPVTPFETVVPHPEYYAKPPYYIFGGLVFSVLSTDLLQSWGPNWYEKAPINFAYNLMGAGRLNKDNRENLVVLLQVLSDDVNVGYQGYGNSIITKVNGKDVKSFKDFVLLLNSTKNTEKFTVLETEQNIQIILKNENIDKIDAEIIGRNSIPQRYSDDVAGWLNTSSKSPASP